MLVNGYRLVDQIKVATALASFLREREPVAIQANLDPGSRATRSPGMTRLFPIAATLRV